MEEVEQKVHYKFDWHRYNVERKIPGDPGVTEALFEARQQALAEEQKRLESNRMLYRCALCGKKYRSTNAHAQHLNSRAHTRRASKTPHSRSAGIPVIKPLPKRAGNVGGNFESMEKKLKWDASCCFICDARPDGTIESCVEHMHKTHGFFIPDAEYLKYPRGLLSYLGLKVTNDFMCLYCNEKRQPFLSLEAVRKHMISKSHCKIHYGDGDLDEFYDYSSRYSEENLDVNFELGLGGDELVIRRKTENGTSYKIVGFREFLRYYRQKPRPTVERVASLSHALFLRYKSMGMATVQSKVKMLEHNALKKRRRSRDDRFNSGDGKQSQAAFVTYHI